MKLKLDAAGNAVIHKDGDVVMPIYIKDDGTEVPFDAAGTVTTIARLKGESSSYRKKSDDSASALRMFEGLDAEAARKALETVANIGHGKLVDASQIEKIRAEAAKVYEGQLSEMTKSRDGLMEELFSEKVGGAFTRSKIVADRFSIPADLVQARFGQHFGMKEGRVYATDKAGNEIYSDSRPGELADFDEALMKLVAQYPYKDAILKGTNAAGGGAPPNGGGGGGGGQKTISRKAFDALPPAQKAIAGRESVIVD